MKMRNEQQSGFTLIEMLLVIAMSGAIILMAMKYYEQQTVTTRIESSAQQMQQILTAAAAYYVKKEKWPADLNCLLGIGAVQDCADVYLLSSIANGPFSNTYSTYSTTTNFYVYTQLAVNPANLIATQIAGKLPLSFTGLNLQTLATGLNLVGNCGAASCRVAGSINVPVQHINKLQALSKAKIYHNGACVPEPTCPAGMTAQIMVVPASASGINDAPTTVPSGTCNATDTSGCAATAYPLTDFMARATTVTQNTPPSCRTGTAEPCYSNFNSSNTPTGVLPSARYWRVCLNVVTEKGEVLPATNPHGQLVGDVLAVTKCTFNNTNRGSGFNVWAQ